MLNSTRPRPYAARFLPRARVLRACEGTRDEEGQLGRKRTLCMKRGQRRSAHLLRCSYVPLHWNLWAGKTVKMPSSELKYCHFIPGLDFRLSASTAESQGEVFQIRAE